MFGINITFASIFVLVAAGVAALPSVVPFLYSGGKGFNPLVLSKATFPCRMVALGDVASVISRSSYLFGVSWPDVRRTLLVAVEQDGDPYAVMIPTPEIIRFYYAPSTRLAQYFGGIR